MSAIVRAVSSESPGGRAERPDRPRPMKSSTVSAAVERWYGPERSPPTRRPSRLVARGANAGSGARASSASSAAVVTTCSQLSRTISELRLADRLGQADGSGRSSAAAMVAPERRPDRRRAPARRGTPPVAQPRRRVMVPTSNASRASCRHHPAHEGDKRWSRSSASRSSSSASRPTSAVSAGGMARGLRPPASAASSAALSDGTAKEVSWLRIADSNRRSSGSGFEPELVAQKLTALREEAEGVGLPSAAIEGDISRPRRPSRNGCAATSASSGATIAPR